MISQVEFYEAKLSCETDAWDLSEALKGGDDIVVVDARSKEAYEKEHIPSALNLPHWTITAESTSGLDKAKTYVSYCNGIGCNASTKGAVKLARLGFRVRELLGGLDWWKRDGYGTSGKALTARTGAACGCN